MGRLTEKTVLPAESAELSAIYESAPIGLCLIGTDFRFQRINAAMAEINGVSIEEHLGRTVAEVVPNLVVAATETMQAMLASGTLVGPFEVEGYTPAKPGVRRYWSETWSPIRNEQGQITAASIVALEITEQKRVDAEKDRALEEVRQRLAQQAALADLGYEALNGLTLMNVLQRAVKVAAEVLSVPLTKILRFPGSADHLELVAGIGWKEWLVGHATVGTEQASQAGFTLLSADPVVVADLQTERRFSGPPLLHEHGVRSGMSVTIPGIGDRPFGVFGVHSTDVRAFNEADVDFLVALVAIVANAVRRDAVEAQRSLLVREMAHRAGNMLQLVSSIATQTFKTDDLQAARQKFSGRLGALARANHSIALQGWQDARLNEVIAQTLAPFPHRFDLQGRDILLPPELCFDLGLVLHELATNSAKYGTLAEADGKIQISWRVDAAPAGRVFSLDWNDNCGRPAPAADEAASLGFGTKLIALLVESKWGGSVTVVVNGHYLTSVRIPLPGL